MTAASAGVVNHESPDPGQADGERRRVAARDQPRTRHTARPASQATEARRDLVADPPEHLKPLPLIARAARGILEEPVQALGKMALVTRVSSVPALLTSTPSPAKATATLPTASRSSMMSEPVAVTSREAVPTASLPRRWARPGRFSYALTPGAACAPGRTHS